MNRTAPDQIWWTAAELAEAALVDMPQTKRRVNAMADRLGWNAIKGKARGRKGPGGGWEYHWTLLPMRAQTQLLANRVRGAEGEAVSVSREEAWSCFEALSNKAKAAAQARLDAIRDQEALEMGGLTRDLSVREAARLHGVSAKSIWNWRRLIEGVRADDRLAYLAPRHAVGARKGPVVALDPEFMSLVKSDWLRLEHPSLTSVYDRCCRIAAQSDEIEIPPIHAVRRELKRTVSPQTEILARRGIEVLKSKYPPQVRDKSALHAMEAVNGDYHKFDVFVRFPAEAGAPEEILRPQMVAFQDVRSGKLLAWRIARSANSHSVQLCLGDLIETWGIPEHVLLDNGREFAAKAITGGSPTRYRFKVRDDDIPGLLTSLGCEIHWATPYSGQSKPIERAFPDLCDRVAKHPAFAGAYTGNSPDAKPENYGSRAIDLDDFLSVLADEIAQHNTRPNRTSEIAYGRSFAEAFAESYETAPIRRATEAQRRLWLLGAEGVMVQASTARISFMKNLYWADWLIAHAGKKVVARFDPAKLWDGLHIYALSGEYLDHVPCQQKTGFFDVEEGRAHARARREWINAEKRALEAHRKLTVAEVATLLSDAPTPDPAPVEPKVVRLAPMPTIPKPKPAAQDPARGATHAEIVADLHQHREAKAGPRAQADDRALFARARTLEAARASGEALTRDQERWLAGFQTTATYKAMAAMEEDFGDRTTPKKTPPAG